MIVKCPKGHLYQDKTITRCGICNRSDPVKIIPFWIDNKKYQEVKMSNGDWKVCRGFICYDFPNE